MRESWKRATPQLDLTGEQLTKLIQPAFPHSHVQEWVYAEGGLANTNIRVRISGVETPYLVRIFERDPRQAEKEFHLNQLVKDKVPGSTAVYFDQTNEITGHPYLIRQWVEGERLETCIKTADVGQIEQMGRSVGAALSSIHSITFADAGFFDTDLNVTQQIDLGSAGLIAFVTSMSDDATVRARLDADLKADLLKFLAKHAAILDEWHGKPCLTHSDFGGSNILMEQKENIWQVAAVLDWEFAFSGTPFFDFGNLLRKPLGELPGFEKSVLQGYNSGSSNLPDEWRKMSLLTDLTAWLDFLSRPSATEQLVADALTTIRTTISAW